MNVRMHSYEHTHIPPNKTVVTKRSRKQFTSYYSYECFALIFSPTPVFGLT